MNRERKIEEMTRQLAGMFILYNLFRIILERSGIIKRFSYWYLILILGCIYMYQIFKNQKENDNTGISRNG